MLTYDTPALRQTGSRNLTGPKTLPTIWGAYMKLVIKYQISVINSGWEKWDDKWAYINKVGKQEVGIWWFQKRFPRYGIPMWSLWPNIRFLPSIVVEKNVTTNILEGRADRGKTVYPPPPLAKCWNNFFFSKFGIWLYCENGKCENVKSEYIFFSCPAKFFSSRFRIKIIFRKKNHKIKIE